jgi:hypothetical protein
MDCHEKGRLYEGFFRVTTGEGEDSETHKLRNDKYVCVRHTMEIRYVEQLRRRATAVGITLLVLILLIGGYIVFTKDIEIRTLKSIILTILAGGVIGRIVWEVISVIHMNADSYIESHNLVKKQTHKQRLTAEGLPSLSDDWF